MRLMPNGIGLLLLISAVAAYAPAATADAGPTETGDLALASNCDAPGELAGDAAGAETVATRDDAGAIVIYRPLFQSSSSAAEGPVLSFSIPSPGAQCFGSCDCDSCTCDSSSCSLEECRAGCDDCFSRVDPGGCEAN